MTQPDPDDYIAVLRAECAAQAELRTELEKLFARLKFRDLSHLPPPMLALYLIRCLEAMGLLVSDVEHFNRSKAAKAKGPST